MANFERQPAHKIWISNLYSGNFIKSDDEFKPNFLVVNGKNIFRVNLIASIIGKYEKEGYASIIADDGSAQIRIKCWGEDCKLLKDADVGHIVLIVGKIKEDKFNENSYYILPEIIKNVEPNFEILRKLELIKEIGKPLEHDKKEQIIEEESYEIEEIKMSSGNLRSNILNFIEKNEEIDFESLAKELGNEKNLFNEITELIKDGEIFEVKGRYKLLR